MGLLKFSIYLLPLDRWVCDFERMQGHHEYQPELFSSIDIESLIPKGHLLRRIDGVLDLSFLKGLTAPLYSDSKGRRSIDPVIFIRMVLLGYLYNIDSDRQLCEEVGYNLAYRWFCRLSLRDPVPDHSSLTRIRDRLGEKTFGQIFDIVVEQCEKAGLVKLNQVMCDGSVIKANASIYSMTEREPQASDVGNNEDLAADRHAHSKDGLSVNDIRKRGIGGKKISNKTHFNPHDPEASLSGKAGEGKSLSYKTHSTIDAESRVIVDCYVTTGGTSETTVAVSRVEAVQEKLGRQIGEIIADRGYGAAENLEAFKNKQIQTNIPLWSSKVGETYFKELADGFKTDGETAHCPEGHQMQKSKRDEIGHRDLFFVSRKICAICPRASTCLSEYEFKHRGKRFAVPIYHEIFSEVLRKQENPDFRKKLWERMWKMEGIFAEAKSHHGMRRARYRGRAKMQIQVYMISTVQNLKRLAAFAFYCIQAFILEINSIEGESRSF